MNLISGKQIKLKFDSVDIECFCSNCPAKKCKASCDDSSKCSDCRIDFVAVYDGTSANASLLGKFCGTSIPPTVISTNHALYFVFESDNKYNRMGFSANYTSV